MVIEYFLEWIETASVKKRIQAASALVRAYLRKDISLDEKENVEAAITILLEDPAPDVRLAIASEFSGSKDAPRHIMSTLASDKVDVAIIVLSCSPIFLEAELIETVKRGECEKQIAVACRPRLTQTVVASICEHGCEESCFGLMMNPASRLQPENLHVLAQRFGKSTNMRVLLLDRKDLLSETRLLLVSKLGQALSSLAIGNKWTTQKRVERTVHETCDKLSIEFIANVPDKDVGRVVRAMINDDNISVAYLMRAVCMGNLALVAYALAELSGVSVSRVEAMLNKDCRSAFKAVYDRAGLPQSAYSIFTCAISAWRRLLTQKTKVEPTRMSFLVTKEVLDTYTGAKDVVVDDLLVLLRKLSFETARESAKMKAAEISRRSRIAAEMMAEAVAKANAQAIAELDGHPQSIAIMDETTERQVTEAKQSPLVANLDKKKQPKEDFAGLDQLHSYVYPTPHHLANSRAEAERNDPFVLDPQNIDALDEWLNNASAVAA